MLLALVPGAVAIDPPEVFQVREAQGCESTTQEVRLDWFWESAGVRDPQLGAYYKADLKRTAHHEEHEGECVENAYTCTVTIMDARTSNNVIAVRDLGFDVPSSAVTIQWVKDGETTVDGTYRGIPFHGESGSCTLATVQFDALGVLLAPIRGEGSGT